MIQYSPVWPHSDLKEVLPNIYLVTGTNIVNFNGIDLQHSRNMVIVRNGKQLTLINTVRLDEKGLTTMDQLGEVVNILRIGAFHGRDDAFYVDRYHANLWALKGMKHECDKLTDIELIPGGEIPFPECSLFVFETSISPEGIIYINREGGILITCDSLKNWLTADEFFSKETAKLYEEQRFFGPASISEVWKHASQVQASDFRRLKALSFHHLLSAHGAPLLNNAYEQVSNTIKKEFNI